MADLTSHEAPAHQSHALPVMLPPGKLVGRDVILARVYSQLKENKPVLVYGASGIGKTALAATLASAYTELPGGVLWLNVNNTPFPELLARIGRALNVKELAASDNPVNLTSVIMNALITARPMIVFDGKIDPQATTEFIMRCTERLPVLLVNENDVSGPWTNIPLGILEPDAAGAMFKHLAPDQTDGTPDLLAALDHIPFAIAVAAGAIRAKKQSPAEFLAALPKRPDITPPLLTLTASFGTLTSALQGMLLLLGATFRGEASSELFSLIANVPEDTVNQALGGLVQQHLVERFTRYGKPYYRLHTITHTFAQTWLRGSGRLEGLQNKVRDAVLAYVRKFSGSPDRLAAEMENFLATARWAADNGDLDVANQLAVSLMQAGDFVNSRGNVYELVLLRRLSSSSTSAFPAYGQAAVPIPFETPAIGADDDEDDDDSDEVALIDEDDDFVRIEDETSFEPIDMEAETVIPIAADTTDDDEDDDEDSDDITPIAPIGSDEDEDEDSEPISTPVITDELERLKAQALQEKLSGNRRQQADVLQAIGREQIKRGQDNEAIASYTDALNIYESLNSPPGLIASLEALANLTAKTDNSQAAVLHATRGAKLAEQFGDDASQRNLLTILGDARQGLGESEEAITVYTEALDLARSATDKASEAMIQFKLGYAQLDNGDVDAALRAWEDALTLFREQGRRDYEGKALAALGTASGEADHWTEAIKFFTSALYIARELKDPEEEMLRLIDLGYGSVQAHQLGQAVLRYRQALHLAYQSGNNENIVSTTVDLGRLLVESQRHLNVTEMLVDAALAYDPTDRDLRRLKERVEDERPTVPETTQQVQVTGTAQQYAANAYALLDNA